MSRDWALGWVKGLSEPKVGRSGAGLHMGCKWGQDVGLVLVGVGMTGGSGVLGGEWQAALLGRNSSTNLSRAVTDGS